MLNSGATPAKRSRRGAHSPSPPAVGETDGGIDQAALARLAELQQIGSPVLLEFVVDQFVSDAPRLIVEMRAALADQDTVELRRAAHALRGNMAFVGARELASVCERIEELARAGASAEAAPYVDRAEPALARARAALRALGMMQAA